MRISEAPDDLEDAYAAARARFADEHGLVGGGRAGVVAAFHAVRGLAYRSGPDRSPLAALIDRRGACTAKHVLLRDLLRHLGERAEVELVAGDFAAGIPARESMPVALREAVRAGGIRDIHCRVIWHAPEGERVLDATWPDTLAREGFVVNAGWDGHGDTLSAIPQAEICERAEAVAARKEAMLAALPNAERQRRQDFLRALSEWIAARGQSPAGTNNEGEER